jgi:hypothetical protein
MFDDKAWEPQKLKIFDGPLYNPGMLVAETEDDDGLSVYLEWDNEQGADTDIGIGIVHDEVSEMTFYAEEIRAGAFLRVHLTLGDHPDLSKLHAYLVFARQPLKDTAEPGEVSVTSYKPVAVTTKETANPHKVKPGNDTIALSPGHGG